MIKAMEVGYGIRLIRKVKVRAISVDVLGVWHWIDRACEVNEGSGMP